MRDRAIIEALRSRLIDGGFNVFLGKRINDETDQLPAVTLHYRAEGDQVVDGSVAAARVRRLHLVCEYVAHTPGNDPLLELLDARAALEAALYRPDRFDPDSLGGLARSLIIGRAIVVTHEQSTDVGVVHVTIDVDYVED